MAAGVRRPGRGYAALRMADQVGFSGGDEYPPYVTDDQQRARWDKAGEAVAAVYGDASDAGARWQAQRMVYSDPEFNPPLGDSAGAG